MPVELTPLLPESGGDADGWPGVEGILAVTMGGREGGGRDVETDAAAATTAAAAAAWW